MRFERCVRRIVAMLCPAATQSRFCRTCYILLRAPLRCGTMRQDALNGLIERERRCIDDEVVGHSPVDARELIPRRANEAVAARFFPGGQRLGAGSDADPKNREVAQALAPQSCRFSAECDVVDDQF